MREISVEIDSVIHAVNIVFLWSWIIGGRVRGIDFLSWPMNLLPCSFYAFSLYLLTIFLTLVFLDHSRSFFLFGELSFSFICFWRNRIFSVVIEKQKSGMYEISVEMYSLYNAQRLFTFTLEGSEVTEIDFLWWPMSLLPGSLHTSVYFLALCCGTWWYLIRKFINLKR